MKLFKKRQLTLLEKAKKVKVQTTKKLEVTKEHRDLAIAWLTSEITLSQLNVALGKDRRSGNALSAIPVYLREAYRHDQIKIILK